MWNDVHFWVVEVHGKHEMEVLEQVLRDAIKAFISPFIPCILLLYNLDLLSFKEHRVKAMGHQGGENLVK